ncbi:F136A-like protein [Mya arenaria]|uniref:F136A-like protein n=1 Tax=Mya arenaria TaxID=6604 RepID=A0ABY7DZA2_MYAAR|nr:protein FAM136A-like [Mya arenaria]WAR02349.1 F136A-like protein [Mya arenaria]
MADIGLKLQNAVEQMMERIDRDVTRKMQGDAFRCSAKCCDDTSTSVAEAQRCLSTCHAPLDKMQQQIEYEINDFQGRIGRCTQQCTDNARDKLKPGQSPTPEVQKEFETCAKACVDTYVNKIPDLEKRIKTVLGNKY